VERIYREEQLSLRLKRRRKKQSAWLRVSRPKPTQANERWTMDFIFDTLMTKNKRFKVFNIEDQYTRECHAVIVDFSISGKRVVDTLERLAETRGVPQVITVDNGSEFTSYALDKWAHKRGVQLDFIRPAKPIENAFIESFNGRLRDECLNENQFLTLVEAQAVIEAWRRDYNEERPHGSIGRMTPKEFAEKQAALLQQNGMTCSPKTRPLAA
jgi:putative transposase